MSTTKQTTKPAKSTSVKEENMSETAIATATPAFVALMQEIKIATPNDAEGVTVSLPNRFAAFVGQPMSEEHAKIIFTHVAGQFRNNQVANAKARELRYAKDAKADDAPWNVDQYLTAWEGYLPVVGGAERQSQSEKMRFEAAKRVWIALVSEHNEAIKNGGQPVLKSPKHVDLDMRPIKTKAVSTADHEKAVEAWQDRQEALYGALLKAPHYADRINAMMETLTAEAGKKKADGGGETASADLI